MLETIEYALPDKCKNCIHMFERDDFVYDEEKHDYYKVQAFRCNAYPAKYICGTKIADIECKPNYGIGKPYQLRWTL